MAAKTTKPKPKATRKKGGGGQGRIVKQAVLTFPEPPMRAGPGRPPDKYFNLLAEVAEEFGAGVPVKVIEFRWDKMARQVANDIRDGKKPVPGGPGQWKVQAMVEQIDDGSGSGGTVRGSALYVEWLGPDE